jgi:hypothetical protein
LDLEIENCGADVGDLGGDIVTNTTDRVNGKEGTFSGEGRFS